jgi:hypothetical protein
MTLKKEKAESKMQVYWLKKKDWNKNTQMKSVKYSKIQIKIQNN